MKISPLFPAYSYVAENLPLLLWGPLFVGAPIRPNMLNMPKSAAEFNFISNQT